MRKFHFIFGLREQSEPFHLAHYLCLESCRQLNGPARINFHYRHLPWGSWWDKIAPHLTLRHIEKQTAGFNPALYQNTREGRVIEQAGFSYAHEADFLRLQILFEEGGCYADIDTLFVRPYPDRFFAPPFSIGEENTFHDDNGVLRPSLCNAVMFAQPGARFVEAWLDRMSEVFNGTWNRHSCFEAARLWETMPEAVNVLPRHYFYRYGWTQRELHTLFERLDERDHDDLYSIHMWAHLWWSENRRDFIDFHADLITPEFLQATPSTYARLARRFMT